MNTPRVWVSTAAFTALALLAYWWTGLHMPDGLWVLTISGTFAAAHLAALVLFDDGSR